MCALNVYNFTCKLLITPQLSKVGKEIAISSMTNDSIKGQFAEKYLQNDDILQTLVPVFIY